MLLTQFYSRVGQPATLRPSHDTDKFLFSYSYFQQVEFYFADSNLPFDKFMWSLHTKTDEHWVPIATIASFKRMRQYLAQGVPWIADVLRRSSELEVDEAGTNVRRKREVQPPSGQLERSVYAKGFGEEVDGIQLEVEEFFKAYGNVNAVRMRRTDAKTFKVPGLGLSAP